MALSILLVRAALSHALSSPSHIPDSLAASDIGPHGCPSVTLRPCSGHGVCEAGHCSCDRGFSGSACARREYLFACPSNCSWPSGQCVDGTCVCATGYSGDDCADRTPVNCSLTCAAHGHGECVNGGCRCKRGFYGPDCLQGCPGFDASNGRPCSGHGLCVPTGSPGHSLDRCKCFIGFAGVGCEKDLEGVTTCARNCSFPAGTCYRGRCTCSPRFAGHDCSIELRHGKLAHALDSPVARLGAVMAVFAASTLMAMMLLRFINVGASIRARDGDKGTPLAVS